MSPIRRLVAGSLAALGLAACAAPSAQAGVLVSSATGCESRSASQVFLPWADVAQYVAAPGATAESRRGWTLDGASIADGNEPWHVVSGSDSRSLSLPAGASATTDAMCVGITHPTLRFFVDQRSGGVVSGGVDVEALYEDAAGDVRTAYIGTAGGYGWHPTGVMVITPALLPLLPGEQTAVAFRFSARGGDFRIDDVHVDPWGRG